MRQIRQIDQEGQAVAELVVILPILLMLAVGVISVVYVCWQGIKVQQAANLAARIEGQERVAGGFNSASIASDNGIFPGMAGIGTNSTSGAIDPNTLEAMRTQQQSLGVMNATVFGKVIQAAKSFFSPSEQQNVVVATPQFGAVGYSDKIRIFRTVTTPSGFGLPSKTITLEGTAYGGEDTHMYGLVRWGRDGQNAQTPFWAQKNAAGQYNNLPKGND